MLTKLVTKLGNKTKFVNKNYKQSLNHKYPWTALKYLLDDKLSQLGGRETEAELELELRLIALIQVSVLFSLGVGQN